MRLVRIGRDCNEGLRSGGEPATSIGGQTLVARSLGDALLLIVVRAAFNNVYAASP